jgi:NifB/MoaA-like Fe-S oxidoreductase
VGGSRKFLEDFATRRPRLPDAVSPDRTLTIVTGTLAVPVLSGAIERLNRIRGLTIRMLAVENRFFGGSVTCAGLLTGSDILERLEQELDNLGDEVLIPSVCLKDGEDVFLDDRRLADLASHLGGRAVRVESTARGLLDAALSGGPVYATV